MSPAFDAAQDFGDPAEFPVGTRVVVRAKYRDFHFFTGDEPGVVVRNGMRYLGIIVGFDQPWTCDHGHTTHVMDEFNFHPGDLDREVKRPL